MSTAAVRQHLGRFATRNLVKEVAGRRSRRFVVNGPRVYALPRAAPGAQHGTWLNW